MEALVRGKRIVITEQTILETRQHFADISARCIEDAKNGKFHVNDLESFIEWQENLAIEALTGKDDHTVTFIQRALWIQTGESIPLLT